MWKAVCVVFCCGLLAVEGDISELENFKDQDPIRIGAFNIQIFGETKFEKPEVAQELVKILSRYDIVLVQEIRDSSETYIYKLVEKLNRETRTDEPFSLVVSARLGRSTSKEQYAFLYRKKYVTKLEVYQYEDPLDLFQRPPYAVKFHSDVLDTMHEFGIIGLHTSPEDAFIEINALSVVYAEVARRFKTPHILIAGDLNADCSYLSRTKMKELSIRNDTSYKWLIDDYEDTTVSGTNCAYDRFIVKENTWPDIIPGSVQVYHYEREHMLTKEVALDVSDHYPIEMELRGKCRGNRAILQTYTPSFSITVEDDRVISSTDLTYIRHIYQKTNERIPQWSAQVYKIGTRMNYVIATRTSVHIAKAIEEIFLFYEAFQRKVLSLETIASLRKLLEEFKCFREPHIMYCMNTTPLSAVDLAVTCTLVDPLTCKIDVSRRLS